MYLGNLLSISLFPSGTGFSNLICNQNDLGYWGQNEIGHNWVKFFFDDIWITLDSRQVLETVFTFSLFESVSDVEMSRETSEVGIFKYDLTKIFILLLSTRRELASFRNNGVQPYMFNLVRSNPLLSDDQGCRNQRGRGGGSFWEIC